MRRPRSRVALGGWAGTGLVVASLLGGPSGAMAQGGVDSCDEYLACALRVDGGGFFSAPEVVRGAAGERVAAYGRNETLRSLFADNAWAAPWYEAFEDSHRTSSWLMRSGAVLMAGGILAALLVQDYEDNRVVSDVAFVAGAGLIVGSWFPARSARNSMSQAIWWYNADLRR